MAAFNIQQLQAAFKLYFLYSSLWLPSNFACHTAAFGCLQALLAIKQPWLLEGCFQAWLAIQQPLAAFQLRLLHSSLWLPSSSACYTAAFGCLQALLVIQQLLAAFMLCLLYSRPWLHSNFACHRAAFGLLQALLAIKQPWLLSSFACYTAVLAAFKLYLLNNSL